MAIDHIEITAGGRCYRLNVQAGQLYRERDKPVKLTPKQWDLLTYFIGNPGTLLTKDRLCVNVWKRAAITDEAISQAVRSLRGALKDDKEEPLFIETDHGRGYRFIANVKHLSGDDGPPPQEREPGAELRPIQRAPNAAQSVRPLDHLKEEQPNVPAADCLDILRTEVGLDEFIHRIHGPDDLSAIEGCIDESSAPMLISNALKLIARLASAWDGRTIKRVESFAVVKNFYCVTGRLGLKVEAARTLASLGTFASRTFLAAELKRTEPAVLAATLSVWNNDIAFWEEASYWRNQITSDLIVWTWKSVEECFFIDGDVRWLHNFGRCDKWNLCLTARTVVRANQERR
jgi:DNA-binding winged helix-turn-helix (wHTH) protein